MSLRWTSDRPQMGFLKFALLQIALVFTTSQGFAALEFEVSGKDTIKLSEGERTGAASRDLIRSHLTHALHIDTWFFDNKNEQNKFKIFPNEFALTVPKAVAQRFENQKRSLRETVEFFAAFNERTASSRALTDLKKELRNLELVTSAVPYPLEKINRSIDALIDLLLGSEKKTRILKAPSIAANVFASYLPPLKKTKSFKFVPITSGPTASIEMMTAGVTQLQWFEMMGTNPSFFSKRNYCPNEFLEVRGVGLCPDWPVETLPLASLRDFIRKFNLMNPDYLHRLPTRAERLSALGSIERSASASLKDVAWYGENSGLHPHPVALKKPSEFGVYDLRGNLWEVTHDTEAKPGKQVIAGGSWFDRPTALEVGYSMEIGAAWTCYDVGFRLVRTALK